MNSSKSRSKVLVPLAVLLAAGALAVGSGATFTSASTNLASSVTSGTLSHTNSKDDQAIFTATGMTPGDTVKGSLTLTNTGSLPAAFHLTETTSRNDFSGDNLTLVITNATTDKTIFDGTFGDLQDGQKQVLGEIAPNASAEFEFVVTLDESTPNGDQGKTASATYTWDSVQLGTN